MDQAVQNLITKWVRKFNSPPNYLVILGPDGPTLKTYLARLYPETRYRVIDSLEDVDRVFDGFEEAIDGLLCFDKLFRFPDPLQIVRKVIKAVSPDGQVLFLGPSRYTHRELFDVPGPSGNFIDPFLIQKEFPNFYMDWEYVHIPSKFFQVPEFERNLNQHLSEKTNTKDQIILTIQLQKVPEKKGICTLPSPMKSHFFSPVLYAELLKELQNKNYRFYTVSQMKTVLKNPEKLEDQKSVILRHDVDISLEPALEMARLEHSLGIKSSYYILISGEFFNPVEVESRQIIKQLHQLGHEVGLHFNHPEEFDTDKKILEAILGTSIFSYSQHNPTVNGFLDVTAENLTNAYDQDLQKSLNFQYVSDSGMRWRKNTVWDLLGRENIYLLAHPEIWYSQGPDIVENLRRAQNLAVNKTHKVYDDFIEMIVGYLQTRWDENC